MIKKLMTSRALPIAAAVFLFATSVSAFVVLKPKRTWASPPTYVVDSRGLGSISGDGGVGATVAAITSNAAWNGAGAGPVINATAGSVSGFQLGDNVPMLNFEDPIGACTGNCLAATFTGFYSGRGKKVKINDADIVTNTAYDWTRVGAGCSSEFYIEGVQVHEIGHALGLGHSNVSGSTMFPSVSYCDNGPATTAADDEAGICELYGCDSGGGGCELGQRGDSCSANSGCCSGKCRRGTCR